MKNANITYAPDVSDVCPWNVGLYVGDEYTESIGAGTYDGALSIAIIWESGGCWGEIAKATWIGHDFDTEV